MMGKIARRVGIGFAALLVVVLAAVAALYAWPLDADDLHPAAQQLSFADAQARIAEQAAAEAADPDVRAECRSQALVHDGGRAAKSVLMLHGYTDCPAQFGALAAYFYDQGYNVYVPLAPRHGTVGTTAHTGLHARELAGYASGALDVTAALGEEAGVVGLSGGGVLATWVTTLRPDDVRRALIVSPFYRPAAGQAPPFVIKPFTVLFGFRVAPDVMTSNGFSYAALSQYMRLSLTMDTARTGGRLSSIAVVTTPNDDYIDLEKAVTIPTEIAKARGLTAAAYEIPAGDGIPHDAIDPKDLGTHRDELYAKYLALYEGR